MIKDEGHVLRRTLYAPVPGKRRRGRQKKKTRWKDTCKIYVEGEVLKRRNEQVCHGGQKV